MRNAGQEHRAIALDLAQVAQHRVEAAIDGGDFRRSGFRQRRRSLATAHAIDGARQFAQRTRKNAREDVGGRQ